MSKTLCMILLVSFELSGAEPVEPNWPRFRGPDGRGLADDKSQFPVEFGPSKSMLWRTDLPLGHGSPCVWADRIFVNAFDPDSKKLEVIAVDRKTGKIAWRQPVSAKEIENVHATSSPATSTPVTDGRNVYVYSGSHGVLAFTTGGEPQWDHPMDVAKSPFGSGTSPVIAGDLLIVTRDYPPNPFMLALNKKDGTVAWRVDLTKPTQMGTQTAHSTPIVWHGQIVLNRPGEVAGYSPADGKRLWWIPTASVGTSSPSAGAETIYVNAPGMGGDTYVLSKLPTFAEALEKYDANKDGRLSADEAPPNDLYMMKRSGIPDTVPGAHFSVKSMFRSIDFNRDGFINEFEYNMVRGVDMAAMSKGPTGILAIRPVGEGALPATAVQWAEPKGAPEVTTPLEYRGRVYAANSGGIVTCLDANSGKVVYRGRVNAPGAYMASPVAGGGKILVASAEGVVSVLEAGDTLKVLANNELGEPIYGTPALVDSNVYVRSSRHLWAFVKAK